MPFASGVQSLFAPPPLDLNATSGFNVGSSLGQNYAKQQDLSKQFVTSLFEGIKEAQKNQLARSLYNQQQPKDKQLPPSSGISNALFGAPAPPTDLLVALAKLKDSGPDNLLKTAQANYYNARSAPVADQSANPDLIQSGVDAYGRPKYASKSFIDFYNESRNKSAQSKEQLMGQSSADAGRGVLAGESIDSISKLRELLFPGGTPESFNREAAFKSNFLGLGTPVPNSFEGQEIFRRASTALTGRKLIETGVAANPQEIELAKKAFIQGVLSNPSAAFNSLNQLEDFYKNYLTSTDPAKSFPYQRTTQDAGYGFKVGEVRTKNGKNYQRQEDGKWLPIS